MTEHEGTATNELSIRPASETDLAFSAQLNKDEGWTDTPEDIRRLMRCEPRGFLIAEVQGNPAGQILSLSYGNVGWIGFLIVSQRHRRKGIGSALMREGIAYLKNSNVQTIKLEARPEAVTLYEQMGFEAELNTWKFRCINKHAGTTDRSAVQPMRDEDLEEVSRLDKSYFMGDRSRILKSILADNPDHCYLARYNGRLKGHVMCRPTRAGFRIGPLVCDPEVPEAAEALLVAAMSSLPLEAHISLSAPETNPSCLRLLSRYGFERMTPNVRMFEGKRSGSNGATGVFALGGLEKG